MGEVVRLEFGDNFSEGMARAQAAVTSLTERLASVEHEPDLWEGDQA